MARILILGALICFLPLCGCVNNPHLHGGKMIAEFKPGECPSVTHTPYQATYVLHQWQQPPDGPPPHIWVPEREVTEFYVRGLGRHEPIGFEKNADGVLVAVAGAEKIPLPDGHYCWHISVETEYRGAARVTHEICEDTWSVICFPFGLAASAVMLTVFIPFTGFLGLWVLCGG